MSLSKSPETNTYICTNLLSVYNYWKNALSIFIVSYGKPITLLPMIL